MSKWLKIRDKVYQGKLSEVNWLFEEVKNKVHDTQVPRYDWITPLETWANRQIKSENTSLRLSLQEFTHLKQRIDDLYNDFAQNLGCEDEVLEETQNVFVQDYAKILQSKENDLKLEITAELIEEKQFPLEVFAEWYKAAHTLSPEKFNEELGNFWGDVWKHAAKGAGYGALAGGAAGGIPSGGMGTFAGAGLGGMAGGLAGGLYGGASNLLKRVWQYRQTQRNFEQTKDKAVDALKKLKDLSQHFDMHPNFMSALDSMINQLGSARAYRWAQSGQTPTDSSTVPGKAVNPMKPHPGWAELGKHSATTSGPTPTTAAPPVVPTAATPAAPTPAPTPTATPAPEPVDPEVEKKKAMMSKWRSLSTRKRFHPHTMTPEQEAELEQLTKLLGKDKAATATATDDESERQAAMADAIGSSGPEATGSEPEATGIKDEKDFLDLYNKVKDDEKTVAKIGMALWSNGVVKKGAGQELVVRPGRKLNVDNFNIWLDTHKELDLSPEDFDTGLKVAKIYAQSLNAPTEATPPDESLGKPGIPTETPPEPGNEPVQPELKPEEELMKMSRAEFKKYVEDLGYSDEVDVTGPRRHAINTLKAYIANKDKIDQADKMESAFIRIGRMFQPRLNLAAIPMNERVNYLKAMLNSRGS
jgi:hypothetical protein